MNKKIKQMTIEEANELGRIQRAKFGKILAKVPTGKVCISQEKLKPILLNYFESTYYDAIRASRGINLADENYYYTFATMMAYKTCLKAMGLKNYIFLIDRMSWNMAVEKVRKEETK